jgi:pSer/pThr/pTyr-binding forkhead associated (FHA) protein
MWKLTIQDDLGNETVVHLVRDEYTVGRGEDNAIRLTERNISRHHAKVGRSADRWLLHDNHSYNGCYVNGARVGEPQPLMHGDLIQLGDYRITAEDETLSSSREDGVLTLPGRPGMNTQNDRLVMLAGPNPGGELLLTGKNAVIGRGEECEISINHPSVSRVHAELRPIGDGRYEVVDLGSANGVRINGVEMPHSLLDARDVVELGDVVLKFIPAGQIYIPGTDETLKRGFDTARQTPQGVGTPVKLAIGAAVVAVGVVVALALQSPEGTTDIAATTPVRDPLAETLQAAKAALDKGDIAGAVRLADELPADSNLRRSAEFAAIHAAWADRTFDEAEKSEDATEKRALLDSIARSPNVDSVRRKRAANELDALREAAVNVEDLPSDDRGVAIETFDADAAVSAVPVASTAPALAQKPIGTSTQPKKPVNAATSKPASSSTLVRKNPFGDQ